MAHAPVLVRKDGGREWRLVIREPGDITRTIVERTSDRQQRVKSRSGRRGTNALLPLKDFRTVNGRWIERMTHETMRSLTDIDHVLAASGKRRTASIVRASTGRPALRPDAVDYVA